jgi:hypothetical protein
VNVQGAFRTRLHPGSSREEVIKRVASVINELGFESIRIGGTSLMGGSFDPEHRGYGWSKYWHISEVQEVHQKNPYENEPWNYNRMAMEAAASAGVSVWIDFHRYMSEADMKMARELADELDVRILGISRDNEPYVPARFKDIEAAYAEFSDPRFNGCHWPVMYFTNGRLNSRKARELKTCELARQYMKTGEGIEIHCYCPTEAQEDPGGWIRETIDRTMAAYGVVPGQIVAGEWSGKNQERWEEKALERVIADYLSVFKEYGMISYYQILGSDNEESGLWNFKTSKPNRGALLFKKEKSASPRVEPAADATVHLER